MHGANAPLLQRMIEKEIRKERQVLKGEGTREPISMEDAVPGNNYFISIQIYKVPYMPSQK
jgi:hypothetical protein